MDYSRLLKAHVRHAAGTLAPFFDLRFENLSSLPQTAITGIKEVHHDAEYDIANNCIRVRPQHVQSASVVGEEVSHYLHEQANPLRANGDWFENFRLHALRETVGLYGALVYGKEIGATLPLPYEPRRGDTGNKSHMLSYHGHVYGYSKAYDIFFAYGAEILPVVARFLLNEQDVLLSGYTTEEYYRKFVEPDMEKITHPLDWP